VYSLHHFCSLSLKTCAYDGCQRTKFGDFKAISSKSILTLGEDVTLCQNRDQTDHEASAEFEAIDGHEPSLASPDSEAEFQTTLFGIFAQIIFVDINDSRLP